MYYKGNIANTFALFCHTKSRDQNQYSTKLILLTVLPYFATQKVGIYNLHRTLNIVQTVLPCFATPKVGIRIYAFKGKIADSFALFSHTKSRN